MTERKQTKPKPETGRARSWQRRRENRDTRQEILAAAAQAFAHKGYEATSLNDIAGKVGIKVPSIYNHFKSKRAILFASLMETGKDHLEQLQRIDEAAGSDPYSRLEAYIAGRIEQEIRSQKDFPMVDVGTVHKILESKALTPAQVKAVRSALRDLGDILRSILEDGKSKGVMNYDDFTATFHAIVSMLDNIAYWYKSGGDITPAEISKRYFEIVKKVLS